MKLPFKFFIVFISVLVANSVCFSQEENSYYIDFNKSKNLINEINSNVLNLKYKDHSGDNLPLLLQAFDDQGKSIKSYELNKKFGLNYYTISLQGLYNDWEYEKTFRFVIKNSNNRESSILIRKTAIPNENLPVANIIANPINFNCDNKGESIIDFYAKISEGKAPYTLTWVVYDENKSKLLYSPKTSIINTPGDSESIRVEADPSYNIFLLVKDACGNETEQNLFYSCEQNEKRRNTLYFSSIFRGKGEN